ncbi:MAG TPA: alpha-galactosidase [Bryobacteraceae bacterium]
MRLEAAPNAPRLVELQAVGQPAWVSRSSELLIDHVFIDAKKLPITWKLDSMASKVGPRRAAFVYVSASPHLRLTWAWQARAGFGPIEHQIRIQNLDSKELWLPFQDSFRFDYQVSSATELEHWYVEKGAGTPSPVGTHRRNLRDGYTWTGTSSTYAHPEKGQPREIIPWMLVKRTGGNQNGWYAGIEFSGCTRLTVTHKGDALRGAAGLNPDPGPFRTRVAPGEAFNTPAVFVGGFQGGVDGAGNVLRRWVRQVLGNPHTWANPNYPLLVNNSWGSGMAVNDKLARRMIRESAELGLDMFHIDAGWFSGVGDWYPDPKKFPQGLAAIADEAHRVGLKLGLWVDWTQAGLDTAPGALNARDPKVRNWMVSDVPWNWKPEPFKGQTIDLGAPAAHAWAQREVERIVADYHLDMLEHDGYLVAQGCDRDNHPHAPPDPTHMCVHKEGGSFWVDSANSTDVSYHAVRAYYDIYSKLRRKHPGLLLEACNDGGRMVDFGTAAHVDYFSITDTYDPLSNRRAFYDASHVLPPAMLESYVEKWPTPHIENFRYMLRSGMMGWLTVMQDTSSWSPEQHRAAKQEFALYKTRLRPLIRDANLYHISPRPDGLHWDSVEYFDQRRRLGVVYAFRGSTRDEPQHSFALNGLNPDATYRLQFHDQTSPDRTVTGRELASSGMHVHLPLPDSSELIFIDEVSSK